MAWSECVRALLPQPRSTCNRRCLATLCKNVQTDLHEIFREGWQWANEQMTKFWWWSAAQIHIVTLLRRALAEVCTAPVLLVVWSWCGMHADALVLWCAATWLSCSINDYFVVDDTQILCDTSYCWYDVRFDVLTIDSSRVCAGFGSQQNCWLCAFAVTKNLISTAYWLVLVTGVFCHIKTRATTHSLGTLLHYPVAGTFLSIRAVPRVQLSEVTLCSLLSRLSRLFWCCS